jgi:hypothetical protein
MKEELWIMKEGGWRLGQPLYSPERIKRKRKRMRKRKILRTRHGRI